MKPVGLTQTQPPHLMSTPRSNLSLMMTMVANDINDVDSEDETNPLITDNDTVTKSHLPKTKSGRINQAPQRYGDWV